MGGDPAAKTVRKLIEVALPLDAINEAAAGEKAVRQGHPSSLHQWWARRPLAAARAVIFAQSVDDPSSRPELFPTKEAQDAERERLFGIIRRMVPWPKKDKKAPKERDPRAIEEALEQAREEMRISWRRACEDNAGHPRATDLFDPERLPAFHDPFAGGGAIPLEAQRLGLEAHASDLNPVGVLINKAMIEIPPSFSGRPPVNPQARKKKTLGTEEWKGIAGLADDVRYYGHWMRDEAERRIGHLYPRVRITTAMAAERPDLKHHIGRELTVIAWLWARTCRSKNPAFADVEVPLVSNFLLSTKRGQEAWVEPVVDGKNYRFAVRTGPPPDIKGTRRGTKTAGKGSPFRCLLSGVTMPFDYLRSEAKAGRMNARLMAVVADASPGRVYLAPSKEDEVVARSATPAWTPDFDLPEKALGFRVQQYGMTRCADLFTARQLTALTTFTDLVGEARQKAHQDAISVERERERERERESGGVDLRPLREGGSGPAAYADALSVYLAFALSKQADLGNSLCRWEPVAQCPRQLFGRQAIPMVWDFSEGNPLGNSSGSWKILVRGITRALAANFECSGGFAAGNVVSLDAMQQSLSQDKIISTDPPYDDNIGYADLSDFFYVWLRHTLTSVFPEHFSTLAVPKVEELVATPHRHGSAAKADAFFLDGMTKAMRRLAVQSHPIYPVAIYYSSTQSESKDSTGKVTTDWETFLEAVCHAGLDIRRTWPMRTENSSRLVGMGTNALASSIVLACRQRPRDAATATWREFRDTLERELPPALADLRKAGIAPVDLAQAAIGPGMAVFTRYAGVLYSTGKEMTVREALAVINEVLDETLAGQESEFDRDTRWASAWFRQHHFDEGDFGIANVLATAKNTSVEGLVEAGILRAGRGRVRLLRPEELPEDWDPATDRRLTVWEMVHHLVRVLDAEGERASANLFHRIGRQAETARALAHLLYAVCDRQKRPADARPYNALVRSWPEIARLAREEQGGRRTLL